MKKKILALLLVVCLLVGFAACKKGEKAPEDTTPIKIGCLQDITGPTSTLGNMVYQGALWAAEEINANGGVNGRQIELTVYDTTGSVDEALTGFTKAVTEDQVCAIIGPPVANIALALGPVSEQYEVPVLAFAVDKYCVINKDTETPYKNMFLFQPNADQQSAIMCKYAFEEAGLTNLAVIFNESNAYSVGLKDGFVAKATELGATVTTVESFNNDNKDFKTILTKIIATNPDAIFAPCYTANLQLITQEAAALGYTGKLICGLDACPPFNTMVGLEDLSNIYFINNVDDTEAALAEMIATVKTDTGIDATNKFFLGYDVMNILAQIIGEVGDDPATICEKVANVTAYEGLTGSITIDPATHMTKGLEMVMFTYEGTTPVMLKRYSAEQ